MPAQLSTLNPQPATASELLALRPSARSATSRVSASTPYAPTFPPPTSTTRRPPLDPRRSPRHLPSPHRARQERQRIRRREPHRRLGAPQRERNSRGPSTTLPPRTNPLAQAQARHPRLLPRHRGGLLKSRAEERAIDTWRAETRDAAAPPGSQMLAARQFVIGCFPSKTAAVPSTPPTSPTASMANAAPRPARPTPNSSPSLAALILQNQRGKFAAAHRKLLLRLEDWRATGDDRYRIPGYATPPPNAPGKGPTPPLDPRLPHRKNDARAQASSSAAPSAPPPPLISPHSSAAPAPRCGRAILRLRRRRIRPARQSAWRQQQVHPPARPPRPGPRQRLHLHQHVQAQPARRRRAHPSHAPRVGHGLVRRPRPPDHRLPPRLPRHHAPRRARHRHHPQMARPESRNRLRHHRRPHRQRPPPRPSRDGWRRRRPRLRRRLRRRSQGQPALQGRARILR